MITLFPVSPEPILGTGFERELIGGAAAEWRESEATAQQIVATLDIPAGVTSVHLLSVGDDQWRMALGSAPKPIVISVPASVPDVTHVWVEGTYPVALAVANSIAKRAGLRSICVGARNGIFAVV